MSRISRGGNPARRNAVAGAAPAESPAMLRRGRVFGGVSSGEGEEILDLLSRTRRGYSISSSGESDVLNRMEKKVSIGLTKAGRGAAEEFLSAEIGKHDYDWLLTPPGTPLFSSMDSTDHQPPPSSQRSSSNLRSASLVKPSRLSVPHSDDRSYAPTTARSSSTARTSLSNSTRTPSSAPNTSTSSVNSRPTTPNNRTRAPAAAAAVPRPSTPRSTTPTRSRPVAPAQTSRPSTPTPRPSTPSRRPPPPVSTSRPSSPVRSRTPVQLPERPVSAGRRGNSNGEVLGSGVSSSRRPSSPAVARGRVVAENQGKGRVNGHREGVKIAENQKPVAPEKKPVAPEKKQVTVKPAMGGETGGYGRTLSKNSLNMAIKHMDIRQGMNSMRGVSLFPHSIRSTATAAAAASTLKNPPASRAAHPPPSHKNRSTNHTSFITEPMPKNYNKGSSERDSIHLKEDERALNWLQSVDESHLFDRRFDRLPEPFILM